MALPITVPYTFGNATTAIPLSNLDSDYATVYQAVNGIGNGSVALANVTITGGTVSNVSGVVPTPFTANGVVYASSTSALTTGTGLVFTGTNLGIGTNTTSNATLTVTNANLTSPLYIGSQSDSLSWGGFFVNGATSSTAGNGIYGKSGASFYYNVATGLNHIWTTNGNETMRIDSSGNLGVGTTSVLSGYKVDVRGLVSSGATYGGSFSIYDTSGASQVGYFSSDAQVVANNDTNVAIVAAQTGKGIKFYTSGANERMRIDSGGNLMVGTTSISLTNTNSYMFGGTANNYSIFSHISGTVSGAAYQYFAYNSSIIGSITQSGTTAVLYNVTSDQRLKENIVDADSASSLIDSLQVRKFDWKTDQTHQRYGFVAQELVTVAPEAVHQPTDPDEMMAVDYSKLVPMLVKEIQSLRKRLADAGIA